MANSVSQVRLMESQIWHPSACSVALWEDGSERGSGLCPPFYLRENFLSSPLLPDNSVPPRVPLVPFKLLPQCWSSERVNLNKSMCCFFKGDCLRLPKFLLPTQSPLVFVARNYGDSSSWHWKPRLGGLVWSWYSSLTS